MEHTPALIEHTPALPCGPHILSTVCSCPLPLPHLYSAARCVVWAEGERQFAVLTDRFTDRPAGIRVFDFPGVEALAESKRRLTEATYRTCGPVRPVPVPRIVFQCARVCSMTAPVCG